MTLVMTRQSKDRRKCTVICNTHQMKIKTFITPPLSEGINKGLHPIKVNEKSWSCSLLYILGQ